MIIRSLPIRWPAGAVCGALGLALALSVAAAPHNQDAAAKQGPAKPQKLRNPLNDLLDEAQADLDKNEYEAAIAPLQKFIAEKPDVAYAHFQLAYAYTALKRPDEARPEYEKAIALDPKMAEAQLNLGILLLEKEPGAAVAPLRKAVELLPAQSRPRFLLGVAQERSGDLAGAAESFESASRLDPEDAEALVQLGNMQLRNGKAAEAEANYRRALEFEAKSAAALQGLAQSLEAQKKPEAVEAYGNYLAAHPGDTGARWRLARCLIDQQQYDEALAEIDRAAAGGPLTVAQLKLRADALIAQKKYNEAVTTLRQAIALAPGDAQLHGGLGRIYLELHDYASAEKELKTALQMDGKNPAYWKDLSTTYYLAGNYQAAIDTLDVVDKGETPTVGEWFIRALCYDKLGQAQPALDAYRRFVELDQNKNPDQLWQANQRIHVLEKTAEKKK